MRQVIKFALGFTFTTCLAGTVYADSFSNIVTSTAPGGATANAQSCDPDGRQSLADANQCLDSYCNGTVTMSCQSGNEPEYISEETDASQESSYDQDYSMVRLIDQRDTIEIRVRTSENLRFSLFSTKESNVYLVRAINGIKIDLLVAGINAPRENIDGDVLLLDKFFVSENLSSLMPKLSVRDARKLADICRFVSVPENIGILIDRGLAGIRGQDDFDEQYHYWKDRPMIPVNNLSNIGRSCWSIARDYR
jgi:hypothetical protein